MGLFLRPGRYFARWLLQLCEVHLNGDLNGDEVRRGGEAWSRHCKKADAERALYLTHEFLTDVAW